MKGKTSLMIAAMILGFLTAWTADMTRAEDNYPTRPITLLVGYAAGGATDLTVRVLADSAAKILGQPIAIVNKPGATSSVALSALKSEKPDGYTIGIMPSGGVIASLLRKLPYDPGKDFTPIMQYAGYQDGIAVRAEAPWKTFKEFMDYSKNNPGKVRYASAGAGTPEHLIMEKLSMTYGVKWLHLPYEGDQPASTALLGGHVDAVAASSGAWKVQADAGKFRLLATFHDHRLPDFPNVPTLIELGYNLRAASLIAIVGPKGLPEKVVGRLHQAFKKAMEDPNFVKTADKLSILVVYRGPEDLQQYVQRMLVEEGEIIEKLGLRK